MQATIEDVVGIAAGEFHALAWSSKGELYAWGLGNSGQLGTGSFGDRSMVTGG